MNKTNLGKILPGVTILFALTALFMIFAPSIVFEADGMQKLTFSGLDTAFGYTQDGMLQYFSSSACSAAYLLLIIGIISIIFTAFGKGGRFTTLLCIIANLISAILLLSTDVLCNPQHAFDLLFIESEVKFSKKMLHLGAGAITGLVFAFLAAFSSTVFLLTDRKGSEVFSTKWIAYTAIMTALVVATGFLPVIPTPVGNIYWVDGMVLLAAYLLDPLAAFIAGGVGSLLYDILKSPSMMVPSLIIHGLQAVIVSTLLHFVIPNKFKKFEWVKALIISIIAAIEVVLGYFTYRCITLGVPVAVTNIPRNIIQEIIGISIAMVICYATTFKKQLEKQHLLPDFRGEVLNEFKKHKENPEDIQQEEVAANEQPTDE